MPRRDFYSKLPKLFSLIKEEIDKFMIDEYFDKSIETNYDEFNEEINGYDVTTYRFKTNGGESYGLNFFDILVDTKIKMNDNKKLCDIIEVKSCYDSIRVTDIGFTVSSRVIDNNDIDDELYAKNTGNNEQIELMARISFLINEFIKKTPNIKIYVVGKNTHETKLLIYKKIFTNIFKNDYILVEGNSTGYEEGAMYFINKSIIK